MATKNHTSAADEAQQEEPKAENLLSIDELRRRHNVSRAVFAGVCSANGWLPGKSVTEEAFAAALSDFTGAAIDGRHPKESKVKK